MSVGFEPRGLWPRATFGLVARWLLSICGCWRWERILTSSASRHLFDKVDPLHRFVYSGGKKALASSNLLAQNIEKKRKTHFVNLSQKALISSRPHTDRRWNLAHLSGRACKSERGPWRGKWVSSSLRRGAFLSFSPLLSAATLSLENNQECSLHVSLIWPRRQIRHTCLNLVFTLCCYHSLLASC